MSVKSPQDAHQFLIEMVGKYMNVTESPRYMAILNRMIDDLPPASASVSNHGGFDGGLIVHTAVVFHLAVGMSQSIVERQQGVDLPLELMVDKGVGFSSEFLQGTKTASVLRVCILHDLNKLQTVSGKPYYVPNMIKNGTVRSDAKPWVINKVNPISFMASELMDVDNPEVPPVRWPMAFTEGTGIQMREGLCSLAVAETISPGIFVSLSDMERNAIIYHDGAYAGRSGLQGNESFLQIILHAADMLASRFYC